MKTKGARLTTDISLPGRFVVFVPQGEGWAFPGACPTRSAPACARSSRRSIGRRRRDRFAPPPRVPRPRTSSATWSFSNGFWKSIEDRAKRVKAPALVYQEPSCRCA